MTKAKAREIQPGLYRVFFHSKAGGGYALCAVGKYHNGDSWYCGSNWTSKNHNDHRCADDWEDVERVELVRDRAGDEVIRSAKDLVIREVDPGIANVIRDLFLTGNDIDAIAVLAEELQMAQWDSEELPHRMAALTRQIPDDQLLRVRRLRRQRY